MKLPIINLVCAYISGIMTLALVLIGVTDSFAIIINAFCFGANAMLAVMGERIYLLTHPTNK